MSLLSLFFFETLVGQSEGSASKTLERFRKAKIDAEQARARALADLEEANAEIHKQRSMVAELRRAMRPDSAQSNFSHVGQPPPPPPKTGQHPPPPPPPRADP